MRDRGVEGATVVVVGAGAVGVSTAYELASIGARPIVLERADDIGQGCSNGTAGLITPNHAAPIATPESLFLGLRWMFDPASPFSLKLRPSLMPWLVEYMLACTSGRALRSSTVLRSFTTRGLELHAAYAKDRIDGGYVQAGSVTVFETPRELARAKAQVRLGHGEILDADGAARKGVRLGRSVVGAVLFPEDAHLDSLRFVRGVAAAGRARGVTIRTGVEVSGFDVRNGRAVAVRTSAGEVPCEAVVIAAGAWSGTIARELGVRVPMQPGKGYHVDLEAAPGDPPLPLYLHESRVIATPLEGRLRLAGTMQLAGFDRAIDRVRVDAVHAAGLRNIDGLADRKVVDIWSGFRPCPPDGLPVIGRVPHVSNAILATGHAMKGVALAPVTGRLVAEMLADRPPSYPVQAFEPARFADPRRVLFG